MLKEIEIKNRAFPGIRQFTLSFNELPLVSQELEILLGYEAGEAPDPFPDMITSAMKEANDLFDIRVGYRRIAPVEFVKDSRQMIAGEHRFSPGSIIFSQIRKSSEVAFFVATAGSVVTERCQQLNKAGETVYSYVLDVLASVVAEKAVEILADHMEKEVLPKEWKISESFSPGYCNWEVVEQQKIFTFFPENFCGIRLSSSSLMYPIKSVSGIIGIGASLDRKGYLCHMCNDQTCIYGRIRRQNATLPL